VAENEKIAVETEPVHQDEERLWYVIHTYSGYENKVRQNLEHRIASMEMQDQIFRVIVPTEEEIEIKNGQRRVVNKKIYPGYVLVQMRLTDDSWYVVRNTPGVTSFVGHGNRPVPLDDTEVKSILKQMEAEAPKVRVSYQVGQAVKITDGPFTEFEGTVDAIDHERGRVRVLVSLFGRLSPIDLDFLQVTRLVD
jgi:transcription termination/antitermination protein NusG